VRRAGAEILSARQEHGLTRRDVARRAGVSPDTERRAEEGDPGIQVNTLCSIGQAVGLDIVVNVYRGRPLPLRDTGQLEIARIVAGLLHASWEPRFEITAGDHGEAADLGLFGPTEIIDSEIDRILGDFQDRFRRNSQKRDWIAAHHQRPVRLVMIVEDTPRNRAAVAPHADLIRTALPADSRDVLRALRSGKPLGKDGLLWIRRRDPPGP
jgi:transcriptional regulator with XRE-family HTH domain